MIFSKNIPHALQSTFSRKEVYFCTDKRNCCEKNTVIKHEETSGRKINEKEWAKVVTR